MGSLIFSANFERTNA